MLMSYLFINENGELKQIGCNNRIIGMLENNFILYGSIIRKYKINLKNLKIIFPHISKSDIYLNYLSIIKRS